MPPVLKEDLRTCPYKMQKRHELSTIHERMKLDSYQHILNLMKNGMVPNLVLTDEKKLTFSIASTTKTPLRHMTPK